MRLTYVTLTLLLVLFVVQNSHEKRFEMMRQTNGPRNPKRMMRMCKKLPNSLRRSCFRRIKKKMREMRKNKRKFLNKKRNYSSARSCGDCFKVGCCDQGVWGVGGDAGSYHGYKFQCRKDEKCRHCVECFKIAFGEPPKTNIEDQGLDAENFGESIDMIPLPIDGPDESLEYEDDLDLTPRDPEESQKAGKEREMERKERKMELGSPQKNQGSKRKLKERQRQRKPYMGFATDVRWRTMKHPKNSRQDQWREMKIKYDEKRVEDECAACRNDSCCSYKDENRILSFDCNKCKKPPKCSGCSGCFNQITFKKKMFKNKKRKLFSGMNANKQLKNYFENRKRNKNLEKLLMQRAGKYGKKINKNMMLKRKKNYKIIKMLKKIDQDPQ